jgi:hypothetical protein
MILNKFIILLILLLISCSTYKELSPKPEIEGKEGQYTELMNSGDSFELSDGKKYFIKFPSLKSDNFYLVFKINNSPDINYYFTDTFDDGKGEKRALNDFDPDSKVIDLFLIEPSKANYYWVIENVRGDQNLNIEYRFTPIWRYKFENQYKSLKQKLDGNKLPADLFGQLEESFNYKTYNYSTELKKTEAIEKSFSEINKSLSEISSLIPKNISETDPAYQNYLQIKDQLKNESEKRMLYSRFLLFYSKIKNSDSSPLSFINESPFFISFFKDLNRLNYPSSIKTEMTSQSQKRLKDSEDYLSTDFKFKKDLNEIPYDIKSLVELSKLVRYNGLELSKLANFARDFNEHTELINKSKSELQAINYELNSKIKWPSSSYYNNLVEKLKGLQNRVGTASDDGFIPFLSYSCIRLVESAKRTEINNLKDKVEEYNIVSGIVGELNKLKEKEDYSKMIANLLDYKRYSYLSKQYSEIDDLSLEKQTKSITSLFNEKKYSEAESAIAGLARDNYFLNPTEVKVRKMNVVMKNEDNLYNAVASESVVRAAKTVDDNFKSTKDLKALYEGENFKPLHVFTYSYKGESVVSQRNQNLESKIAQIKTIEFPEKAINYLYPVLMKDIDDNGVEKAKAIIIHGNNYKGKDGSVWYRINECDPVRSKLLDKTTSYRKIICVPVNDKGNSENEYIFKVHLNIPTKAKFPVYELNMKLPPSLANEAEVKSWYTSIKINGNVIKNEGRVSIVTPSKKNNYEAQISPLQVNKDGTNVLEVKFKHPLYTVFEVSVMAQKPLIKKN